MVKFNSREVKTDKEISSASLKAQVVLQVQFPSHQVNWRWLKKHKEVPQLLNANGCLKSLNSAHKQSASAENLKITKNTRYASSVQ